MAKRIPWAEVLVHAAEIVRRYDTAVTLRQLFYQLVSDQTLPNTQNAYKGLSDQTAKARRAGRFPALVDRKRSIEQFPWYADAGVALQTTARWFRLDRTAGQEFNVVLAVEKDGLVTQLQSWFNDRGLPVTALQGYSGQSHADDVRRFVERDGRPAVLLYAGDFDPTGVDIDRDFVDRTDCWEKVIRVALNPEQVDQYRLPENPGKETDSRAKAFAKKYGRLVQVEVDALDPNTLRQLFEDALEDFWDTSAYDDVIADEADQRSALTDYASRWSA